MTRRIVAIDVVRGFAILWVILYHLWTDLRYPNVYPSQSDAFRAVPHRIADGNVWGAATAVSDAFLRVGYLGVPLFMMLSGLSLTIVALERDTSVRQTPRFLARRLRRVMLPYWAGFVLTIAFAAALALVQWQRHGGATYLHYLQAGDIDVDGSQLIAGAFLVPRIWRDGWQFAPEGSLWFVLVVVQYYLLFPLLLPALKRIGPSAFVAAALAVTLTSLAGMIAVNGDLLHHRSWIEMGAPFRIFEFATGMAGGYVMVQRPEALRRLAAMPVAAASVAVGAAVFVAGCMIDLDSGMLAALQEPFVVIGLALVFAPIVVRAPGRFEATAPARALAWIGVISYTVLIVNEPLRSVTHTMSAERAPDLALLAWAFVLIPLTLLLARPLAVLLGVVERQSPPPKADDLLGPASAAEAAALHP